MKRRAQSQRATGAKKPKPVARTNPAQVFAQVFAQWSEVRSLPPETRSEHKAWHKQTRLALRGTLPAPAPVRATSLKDGEAAVFLSAVVPGDKQAGVELLEAGSDSFWQEGAKHLANQGHDFRWLLDLQRLGGTAARQRAVAQVQAWLAQPQSPAQTAWQTPWQVWQPEVVAGRLRNWSLAWSFFATSADLGLRRGLAESHLRQATWLARLGSGGLLGTPAVMVSSGCLLAFLTHGRRDGLYDTTWRRLFTELHRTLLPDGGTIERAPAFQYELLLTLATLHAAACRAQEPAQAQGLEEPLAALARTLALYRHGDGELALFHGSTARGRASHPHSYAPDLLLAGRRVARWGRLGEARETGFVALTCGQTGGAGKTKLILDCGARPPAKGTDGHFHLAPGALEVSIGKERVFGNCGTTQDDEWRTALRRTAAHSLLALSGADCGAFAKAETWLGRGVIQNLGTTRLQISDDGGASLIIYSHEGWRTWRASRALKLSHDGAQLEGCETLTPLAGASKQTFALRFHLARGLPVVRSRDGASLLLRLNEGGLWRLRLVRGGAGRIRLEEGVSCAQGVPQKALVAVIEGATESRGAEVVWSLARE